MKKILISLLICFLATSAFADDKWTKKDTAYQVVFITFMAADWLQTKEIAKNSDYYETNLFLGKYPNQNEVDCYFLITTSLHTGIAYCLPEKYRRIWQCLFIGIQANCISHNYNAGIRISF